MLDFLSQFASAHPLVFTFLVWPLVTSLVTGIAGALGHLSADDYAKLPSWLAMPLRLLAAYGTDAPEILAALAKLFGKSPATKTITMLCLAFGALSVAHGDTSAPQTSPMALAACNTQIPPVPPPVVNTILSLENEACVIGAALMGASTPAEFQAACTKLPPITQSVLAAINAAIDAFNSIVDALSTGAPDGGAALAGPKPRHLMHVRVPLDGGR